MLEEKTFHYRGNPLKPIITIDLSHSGKEINIKTVVDSGADISIFDASIAEQIGVPYTRFEQKEIAGIHGNVKAYFCIIQVKIIDEFFSLPVAFVPSYTGPFNILGRKGFFEKHRITFDEAKLEIIVAKNSA